MKPIGAGTAAALSLPEVLGLKTPESGEWARLHGPQYALQASRLHIRVTLHIFCTALIVILFLDLISPWVLAAWGLAVLAAALDGARIDAALADADQRQFTRSEYRRNAVNCFIKGFLWSIPIAGFSLFANDAMIVTSWAVVGLLVLGASASRFTAPLGAVIFCCTISVTAGIGYVFAEQYILALVALCTTGLAALGAVENSRVALLVRQTEMGMNEKSEVVSLLLREFEEGDADWLWQIDTNRKLRGVSPRFAFALSREAAEVEGQSFIKLISGKAWENGQFPSSLHSLADKIKKREHFSNLVVEVQIQGERRWWELSGTPMLDEKNAFTGFRGVGSDVTAQRESSEKIAYLARYDTLTSLPNRLLLTDALQEALQYSEKWRGRCAFLMIDLDRFKSVNDSLGHMVGDQLLEQVAARLKGIVNDHEVCGRLGGDEFAVVITDAGDRSRVDKLAKAVIEALSKPYKVEHHTLYVGASVGSAIGPRDGDTVEKLLRNADLALYRAKDAGGGEHCEYEPSLHAFAEERRKLELALRHALENEELLLNFQPVVDAKSEKVVSFEALVRWISEEHGFVSPGKFIPLAEDTRLIVPIGQWVLQQACLEAAKWPEDVGINVNVSPEQLIEPDFPETVVRALAQSGLPPQRLEIEVTESVFLRDAKAARQALEDVMALGCSIALDDFGTGYSSLGYLRKLSFSTIKVDRSFVQGASQNSAESLAIIRAVVAMAESIEMTTTAEGVETAEEVEMIRSLGCDKIQGFYFGRPMPVEDVHNVLLREAGRRFG